MPEPTEHPAVTFLLAAHAAALGLAQATTPVPMSGEWSVVRDKHADRDAPLTLIQGRDPHESDEEYYDREDYNYGVPVIALVADWQTEAEANLRHIAMHDPCSVLRRVKAERELLAEHASTPRDSSGTYCQTCSQQEEQPQPVGWWMPAPCAVWTGIAKAWGWTA